MILPPYFNWWPSSVVKKNYFFALITAYLLNYIANGKSDIEDQDEREVYLSKKASGVSYVSLVVCLGVILFLTEGTAMLPEFNNIPLVVCFSLSIVIYPMVRAIIFFRQQ